MFITNISQIIKKLNNNEFNSLMIDGKWGIGKTFNVDKFFSTNQYEYSYFSLFGIESRDSLMSLLSEKIDPEFINLSNGHLFFSTELVRLNFNGHFVIFDDLERCSLESLRIIHGIFDSLIKLGFKLICLCNSCEIKDDYFEQLKEKIFDLYIPVEADYRLFNDITHDVEFEASLSFLEDANSNWRIIIRSYQYFEDFKKYLLSKKQLDFFDKSKISKTQLFRCFIIATNCILSQSSNNPIFEKASIENVYYEDDVDTFGRGIANKLYFVFNKNKEALPSKQLTRIVTESILNDDYSLVLNAYFPSNQGDSIISKYPFNKDLFLYDDDTKQYYKKAFFDNLNNFDFNQKSHMDLLKSFLINMIDELSQQEQNLIIQTMVDTIKKDIERSLEYLHSDNREKNNLLSKFKVSFNKAVEKKSVIDRNKKLDLMFEKKDYEALTDYLYKNMYEINDKKKLIAESFSEKDYLLPDLSKTLTNSEWSYCHEICRFISDFEEYIKLFIDVLNRQCDGNMSKALKERCNALVGYNFKHSKYYKTF